MHNPLPSEQWSRVAHEAAALREGDLQRVGALEILLAEMESLGAEDSVAPMRHLLAELTTADETRFHELHDALNGRIRAVIEAAKPDAAAEMPPFTPFPARPPESAAQPPGPTDWSSTNAPIDQPESGKAKEEGIDRELFLEFFEESLTHLQSIELNILAMEMEPGNRKYIDNIFRPFHTIKGVSGFLNLRPIHEICHNLESLLDDGRRGRIVIAGEVVEVILEAVDLLQSIIASCRELEPPHAGLAPFQEQTMTFLARVARVREGANEAPPRPRPEAAESAPADPPPPQEPAIRPEPSRAQAPDTADEPRDMDEVPSPEAVTSAQPAPAGSTPDVRSEMNPEPKARDPRAKQSGDSGESVRVRVGLLNQLMNLAGELVLGRNQLLQKLSDRVDQVTGLNAILQHVDRVTSEVQEAVMQTRMQPIGGLFSRFHRVARDLARSLGKQIELRFSGESVELDKSLIEALADPLTHLIRNAADHGIETPEVRQSRGKLPTGSIVLNAHQEGGKVRVAVSDDGAGVNLERVRLKALEKGIATREQIQQMSERETLQLLFAPGFSTAETVTGVSGRGVGMDVVRENVERIGGTVEIETRAGEGTTFHLDLPLTLAIIPALIVMAGDQRFAIPQVNLLELVHLQGGSAGKDLLHVGDTEVYRLRGSMLPLLRLSRVLGLTGEGDAATGELSIAVVAAGEKQFGLVVDRIFDTEEIVVKPLGNMLKHLLLYVGATLMGDGRPALILDMAGLARAASLTLQEESDFGARTSAEEDGKESEEQTLLLFTINPKDQFAVPLSLVSRLEEVPMECLVDSLQGKVIPYRGRLLPLMMLEDLAPIAKPSEDRKTVTVVVFEIEREVGLVVTRIVDALQAAVQLDTQTVNIKGFSGIALVQDRQTAFVDIYQLIELAYPQWFQRVRTAQRQSIIPEQVTILLAEDSGFYRTVEKNYLIQEGFNVLDAEDGEKALQILRDASVDLLITDIDMPKMNGFELTRRIRANPEWRDLPVIAVTALANESDRETGRQAGVNAYLVKLEREQLIQEVMRQLSLTERSKAQKVS